MVKITHEEARFIKLACKLTSEKQLIRCSPSWLTS